MRVCDQCGTPASTETEAFCQTCAKPLPPAQPPVDSTPAVAPQADPAPTDATAPTIAAPAPEQPHLEQPAEPTKTRRGIPLVLKVGVALVGLVAVGVVGFNLIGGSSGGSGGASSPEGAVELLLTSIDSEDPLGALASLAPREVQTLGDGYARVEEKTGGAGLSSSSGLLSGIDLSVTEIELSASELTDDVSRVLVEDALVEYTITSDEVSPVVSALIPSDCTSGADGPCSGEFRLSDVLDCRLDEDDFRSWCFELDYYGIRDIEFITVRDGGRWYVSPVYTVAETATQSAGLSGGDFRNLEDERPAPPEDIEDLFDQLADGVEDLDPAALLNLVSVDTFGLERVYDDAIDDLLDLFRDEFGYDIEDILDIDLDSPRFDAAEDGDRIIVTLDEIRGSGTVTDPYYGDTDSGDLSYRRGCIESDSSRSCVPDRFMELTGLSDLFVVAVKEDGGVRLSPMATLTEYVSVLADNVDPSALLRFLDMTRLAEPTALTLGEETDITLTEAGTWTGGFDAVDGQIVCAGVDEEDWYADIEVFGPDGQGVDDTGECFGPLTAGAHVVTVQDWDRWEPDEHVLGLWELVPEEVAFPATVSGDNEGIGSVSAYRFEPTSEFVLKSGDDDFYGYDFFDLEMNRLYAEDLVAGEEVLLVVTGSGPFELEVAKRVPPTFGNGSNTVSATLETTGAGGHHRIHVTAPASIVVEVDSEFSMQAIVLDGEEWIFDDYVSGYSGNDISFYAEPGVYDLHIPVTGYEDSYTLSVSEDE